MIDEEIKGTTRHGSHGPHGSAIKTIGTEGHVQTVWSCVRALMNF